MSDRDIVERLRCAALPDPADERQVLHAPLLKEAAAEIERLRARVKRIEKDAIDEARSAAAEARWKERQGDEYGSY